MRAGDDVDMQPSPPGRAAVSRAKRSTLIDCRMTLFYSSVTIPECEVVIKTTKPGTTTGNIINVWYCLQIRILGFSLATEVLSCGLLRFNGVTGGPCVPVTFRFLPLLISCDVGSVAAFIAICENGGLPFLPRFIMVFAVWFFFTSTVVDFVGARDFAVIVVCFHDRVVVIVVIIFWSGALCFVSMYLLLLLLLRLPARVNILLLLLYLPLPTRSRYCATTVASCRNGKYLPRSHC